MTDKVPLLVLGGFLGSGKTTLLNRILTENHGIRYAVLVNDFGELSVDDSLVTAHDGETVNFANGCVCCSMGDNMVESIDMLLESDRRPEQIIVEGSGVADPMAIADVATLHPLLRRDLVVVLADTGQVRSQYHDVRLRETIQRQLRAADILVLNKCDLATPESHQATREWAGSLGCSSILEATNTEIPLEVLSGNVEKNPDVPASKQSAARHDFVTRTVHCAVPIDASALRIQLREMLPKVLRAKGFLLSMENGKEQWLVVQVSGKTVEIEPWQRMPNEEKQPVPALVFIGLHDLPEQQQLEDAVDRAVQKQ